MLVVIVVLRAFSEISSQSERHNTRPEGFKSLVQWDF